MPFDAEHPAPAPRSLNGQARPFLRSLGYTPSDWCGDRTVKSFLHDEAYRCDACEDWFRRESDMADDRERECFWCRWGYAKPVVSISVARVEQKVAA